MTENVPGDKALLLANSTIDVFVRGGMKTLSSFSADDFSGVIDYQDVIIDASGSVEPKIVLPKNLTLLRVTPPRIKYTIRK